MGNPPVVVMRSLYHRACSGVNLVSLSLPELVLNGSRKRALRREVEIAALQLVVLLA
jgi:hypothetical protein